MSSLRISFLVVTLMLLSHAADAATAKDGKAPAYGTRAQLRECLDLDDALKARLRDMQAANATHNQKFEAIDAEEARLVEMKAKLDRNDKTAILAFNQAVRDHQQHIQQANQESSDADVVAKAYAGDEAAMNDKCGSLTYRPADVDAVGKERKKAAAVAAAASAP